VTPTDGQMLPLPALPLDGKRPPLRRDLPAAGQHNGEIMAELGWGGGRGSD
jgi:crotonobetainyl-CoA:carnitine CoA-transferase CaiB-like acyl-CoA transferase